MAQAKVAFIFPGQGRVPERLPPSSAIGDELLALAEGRGLPLRQWMQEGRADLLAETSAAQPAILIDSLAKEERLRAGGIRPAVVAGHSLGEYAASVSAGVLSPREALSTVIERGRLMAGVPGGMAAIVKLPLDVVRRICAEVGEGVVVANVNGPGQVVISGSQGALERAGELAEREGGRAIPLRVPGPFHSPLMEEAQAGLRPVIEGLQFREPQIPLVSSVSGTLEVDPREWKSLLLTQITTCVRWVDVVERLVAFGVARAIEVGPGDVLVGLGRRIAPTIEFSTAEEVLNGRL